MPQGCLKDAPRCLKEASMRPQGSIDEATRGIERHREASRGIKEASKRPQGGLKEAPTCLKDA